QEEALEVADRIAVLAKGKIEQVGTPEEVYEHPANAFVLQFLGTVNQFHGRQTGEPGEEGHAPAGKTSYVRPHDVEIVTGQTGDAIAAEVEHVAFAGATVSVTLKRLDDGTLVEAQIPRPRQVELGLQRGQKVYVAIKEAHTFDTDYSI
ncbi:MAG: sulfate transporter ATP-binding protein, partial [Phycisphaerales bacterium]|nr:sulfate transporter ATP-binding protein [Phycisphaerales bacterium]